MARAIVGNLGETISKISDSFTDLPKINAPSTTVVNRAQVTDFSADGLPKWGIDRIMTQQLTEVQGEQGPNGERVFKALNDIYDQVRFIGGWVSGSDSRGTYTQQSSTSSDYLEISFYGTALNVLTTANGSTLTLTGGVDGASDSTLFTATSVSTVIHSRNYVANMVLPVVSGLSLGWHTVRFRVSSVSCPLYGFEVINTSSSIFVPSAKSFVAGKRLYQGSTGTTAYNSDFEFGTLGTRGGHVVIYQKSDGTIAKAVTPTNASAAYLTNADHTNEEVVRRYNWREFGAGRTDDMSSVTQAAAVDRAYTLDDGTTTLVGRSVVASTLDNMALAVDNTGFVIFTFVGTGLDIVWATGSTGSNANATAFQVFVDNVNQGNWDQAAVSGQYRIKKICSGLPYGTHTVRISRGVADVWSLTIKDFIVYIPKKPTLPSGAVELSSYCVMANYSVTNTYGSGTVVSPGVLRKMNIREFIYSGTWLGPAIDSGFASGFNIRTQTGTNYVEYVFFGTGIEFRPYIGNYALNWTFTIDGAAPTGSTFTYQGTGLTYTAGTGVLSGTTAGAASYAGGVWSISGLTLGIHRIRVTFNSSTDFLYVDAFSVITPIHFHREQSSVTAQNAAIIGSCAIKDSRKFSSLQVTNSKISSQAIGISSGPTTTSGTDVPLPDMSIVIKTTGNPVMISFDGLFTNNSVGQTTDALLYVDGVSLSATRRQSMPSTSGYRSVIALSALVPLASGVHKIDVYWAVSGGTGTAIGANRTLIAREI